MGLLPLPSHIHYELLLQLLERQTLPSLESGSAYYSQVQNVIIQIRKALSCQKQLEENCRNSGLSIEHRWSLNAPDVSELRLTELLSPEVKMAVKPQNPLP
jgi:Family of unknown function (DUF5340)